MIPKTSIQRLSSRLSIPEKNIEQDYVISWILIGLTYSDLHKFLLFKGGTALKKFYFKDYRFSEDLDFTLVKDIPRDRIREELRKTFVKISELANIPLQLSEREESFANTYALFINYSGPLGADISRGEIKTDITINEELIHQPKEKTLSKEYDEYYDLLYDRAIMVYDIKEIFIEKLCCLLARIEPRDLYDLHYLLNTGDIDQELLTEDFKKKAASKKVKPENLRNKIDKNKRRLEELWEGRLKNQLLDLPEFDSVYRELKRALKAAKFI